MFDDRIRENFHESQQRKGEMKTKLSKKSSLIQLDFFFYIWSVVQDMSPTHAGTIVVRKEYS